MVQRLTWLVPLVLLQGCAGTPLAERLETSFGAQDAALLTTPSDPTPSDPPSSNQPQEPYRITIRLSGADPAAPAEAVTRVLRNADVSFAVERIERIQP